MSPAGEARCISTTTAQQEFGVRATNDARSRAGLPPVRANATLARAAAEQACDMARQGRMTHAGSSASRPGQRVKALGYRPRITAENIAAGPYNLEQVLSVWSSSSGHLRNISIPQIRDFGIGQAIGPDGRTRYWAAVYGAPR
ncbi:CAP domain-containing protein [Paracoccus alkanivorans]|uniref:CAP domain-containing protein n=2 Tax=Paracoccus alkanivorans TaxID=2116655 RepID=A0A3M0MRL0_9RHOB|nr:CAP domain-containing protein [Paracoccus alkanivorans]